MNSKSFMLIAGETSGDLLAAELVENLRKSLAARGEAYPAEFFGMGGMSMVKADVELIADMSRYSVIGVTDVLLKYPKFRRLFVQLLAAAFQHRPDVIIGVDYGGFNLRFARVLKKYIRENTDDFHNWNPKFVQLVSPQVWASRPERAFQLAEDCDLLLSIFPFEKEWYARHTPKLRVEFVGHPMFDRFAGVETDGPQVSLLLLPGSREAELRRHVPVMVEALKLLRKDAPNASAKMVLPDNRLIELVRKLGAPADLSIQVGGLPAALAHADVAIASTGTVTMECAYFGVPAVTLYKTSWFTYQIAKSVVSVKSITMPNLLAGEMIYPEFVQDAATPKNIAAAAFDLLCDERRRADIKQKLVKVIASLGGPGASARAAEAILNLVP
jgi:lipid-A-disaccharide synthase